MKVITDGIIWFTDDDTIESIRVNYPAEISDLYVNAYKESKTFEELETRLAEFDRQADAYDEEKMDLDSSLLPADFGGLFDE